MPCYPCSHCNKCGIFSIKLELTCLTCGADVVPGQDVCLTCGTPYAGNTKRGKIGKPEDTKDYYTEISEARGEDAYHTIDFSDDEKNKEPEVSEHPGP